MSKPRALTDEQAMIVYVQYNNGIKPYRLAAQMDCSESTIHDCGNSREAYSWVRAAIINQRQEELASAPDAVTENVIIEHKTYTNQPLRWYERVWEWLQSLVK